MQSTSARTWLLLVFTAALGLWGALSIHNGLRLISTTVMVVSLCLMMWQFVRKLESARQVVKSMNDIADHWRRRPPY